jgi:hypothetical protein
MFARLGCDNLLLDALQQLLSFGQAQTKIADRVEITGPVDLHHIDAPAPTCGIRLHQTQDPAHAFSSGRCPAGSSVIPALPPTFQRSHALQRIALKSHTFQIGTHMRVAAVKRLKSPFTAYSLSSLFDRAHLLFVLIAVL